jgi:hypothetical protein
MVENEFAGSSFLAHQDSTLHPPIDVSSSSSSSSSDDESHETGGEDDQYNDNTSKQLVLYDPSVNGTGAIEPVPDPIQLRLTRRWCIRKRRRW